MAKEEIKFLIKTVIGWGLGGVLMVIGALCMIFYRQLNIDYPYWVIIGCVVMTFGFMSWVITTVIDYKKTINKAINIINEKENLKKGK